MSSSKGIFKNRGEGLYLSKGGGPTIKITAMQKSVGTITPCPPVGVKGSNFLIIDHKQKKNMKRSNNTYSINSKK